MERTDAKAAPSSRMHAGTPHGGGNSDGRDLTNPAAAANSKEEEADACLARQDLEGALHCLDKAIFLTPENTLLYAKRAEVYWELCDLHSAMANYRKLLSLDANPPQRIKDHFAAILNVHGYSLLLLNETPSIAIVYLSEAIRLNGLDETYWLHRALAYIQANAYEKALKDIDHCICLNGKDVEYFVLRAKLHWRLHMHEKATSDIQRAAMLMPTHPEVVEHEQRLLRESQAHYDQACRHLMLREFAEAIKSLTSAAEISPDETKVYVLRASAYRELGDFHVALKDIERATSCHKRRLAFKGKKASWYQSMAAATAVTTPTSTTGVPEKDQTKEYREIAIQRNLILNEIARKFLNDRAFHLALNALNQVIRGELELAELFHEQFINPQYYVSRGDAYRGLRNFQAALADYHHALELVPNNHDICARVALIHYQFGVDLFNSASFEAAELEFQKAIEQDSTVPMYVVRKGDCARYMEKHAVAVADYTRALELNPDDDETRSKLRQYMPDTAATDQPSTRKTPRSTHNNQRRDQPETTASKRSPDKRIQASIPIHVQSQTWQKAEQARKSYEKKNVRVQELFDQRPSLWSPHSKASKRG
ncbi:TPA: hypothetical protein N0F65_007179 [Lagenidium giganteum]|uniref:Uncharacterized protein n=1 Tax=Lagenidium giganteum TaxID=4803 RepID=A0AAV2ZCM7_9STRA|nr:TPA: hypothetical protein N0F65_007179 [Lagenidium giganteum]